MRLKRSAAQVHQQHRSRTSNKIKSKQMLKKLIIGIITIATINLPLVAFAQTDNSTAEKLTKYKPGTCIDNEGGQWQQLADGTWAPPDDELNTCAYGVPNSWIGDPQYDPWSRAGLNQNLSYLNRMPQYPWGTNYPGGYSDQSDWFRNCVLVQSIIQRPECQAFPRYGNFMPYNYPLGNLSGSNLVFGTKIGSNVSVTARIPLTSKIGKIASSVLMGWAMGQYLK